MTPELKEEWACALESGKFPQSVGLLRRVMPNGENRYCCLGVLREILKKRGVTQGGRDLSTLGNGMIYMTDPKSGLNAAGLTTQEVTTFVGLNDDERLTFPQIAKHVRALPNDKQVGEEPSGG